MKFFKNRFLFIILISVITLVVLIVGAIALYEDTSSVFASDGYILETTTKTNKKYYFSANTKYKENVDNQITFSDSDSNEVTVNPANFVHYLNGNVTFLKKGALVNLADINSQMVSYYNIATNNTIVKEKDDYTVISNDKKINIESFVGRINDNKYLIAGKDVSIKVPKVEERIAGDYFEIHYIEEGIVKIDNQEASYQVTAQDSYVYIGDDITINLVNGKIIYRGDAKMLLSQITINGDENINLDADEELGAGGGSGSGSGSGEGEEETDEEEGTGEGDGTGEGEGTGEGGDGSGEGEGGEGSGGAGGSGTENKVTETPQIELIEAKVTSTKIELSLQLNNANLAKGPIVAYLTNVATGAREYAKSIDLVNGTFKIIKESLSPSTEYMLRIVETIGNTEQQYFQKTFKTNELGISLEKVFATDGSLAYKINFEENSEVTKATISIYDNNGSNANIDPNELTVSKEELDTTKTFTGLKSNTSYSINVNKIWINNAAYSDVYTINRIDTTLKAKPSISGVEVEPNSEEVKFTIKLENVEDKDKSIVSYTYNIYLADDVTLENLSPEVKYSITKNDSDPLVLNLNEIDELNTGVDYRCKIIAQYNDNEMIREVSTDYSGNFLIKSKPNVRFELKSATMNKVEGTLSLIDANCTVPMNGRACFSIPNTFTLRYYKLKEAETTENDKAITFNSKTLTSDLKFEDLSSNTTYAVKIFGNYYDDESQLHANVQIGDTFYITTDKSPNLTFEIIGDNKSGYDKNGNSNLDNVVTFDAKLTAPQDSTIMQEISTITLNLYSGRYNTKDKLIGQYIMTNPSEIEDFFSNITIHNGLFTDVTKKKLGLLNEIEKLIKVTNNSTQTLNGAYTVEVEDVYDQSQTNKITVENNVYTFNLTPSYYLDSRIETNPKETYVTVTPITKENLTKEEYEELKKSVSNLDDLKDKTVVGLTIENSLSDIFVDSAYTYEKVIVNYIVKNEVTGKEIASKSLHVDMGNKYQPKEQTIYLDSSDLDDGITYFTRGYKYKIGFTLSFITEDGSNPTYTHSRLHKILAIEKQTPDHTQYISTSDSKGITYRYSFKDIDKAILDNNFYYSIGTITDPKNVTYYSINKSLNADGEQHTVTVPLDKNNAYSLYYAKKNTDGVTEYIAISNYTFETEYDYDGSNAFTIVNDNDNVLKLKLEDNDATNRAIAYKVVIKPKNNNSDITDYVRYFLASKLNSLSIETQTLDAEGKPETEDYKYIAIDYAAISKFMGTEMEISLFSYYDSGLVGIDQKFESGLILKNNSTKKYLNIYNGRSGNESQVKEEDINMGIYYLKKPFQAMDTSIYLYNKLRMELNNNKQYVYNPRIGAPYYDSAELPLSVGINFNLAFTDKGELAFVYGKNKYADYTARVLKEDELNTNNNVYKFNAIVPTIKVDTKTGSSINSIEIQMTANGIYGNKQFIKDGAEHKKIYVEVYSDEEAKNKLTTLKAPVTIEGNEEDGYTAKITSVEYKNLTPATKYYVKIYAYIDGKYTWLYDDTDGDSYVSKIYEASTLDALDIIDRIRFSVVPTNYIENEMYPLKTLTWNLKLKSTENYKLRFELYEPDGTESSTNSETGEEIEVPKYKQVNFNGTSAASCDINKTGTNSNGYVNNCYISVPSADIESINNKNNIYTFKNNDFVFGDNYYKLIVYAVPFTNNTYDEQNKLILYQNDSLKSTGGEISPSKGIKYNINIPKLEEASFSLGSSLTAGYSTTDGYYVAFTPTIIDTHKVINYGIYNIYLKDEKGTVVKQILNVDADIANNQIKFTELSSNTLYYVELTYETYRNNVGYSESQKTNATPFTDFTYTPIDAGITLGTITAGESSGNVTLTYNGSANLSDNIVGVDYTISLKGGSSKTTGSYEITSDTPNIFTIASDKTPKLIIDTSDSKHSTNTSFTFKPGNTYIITTIYYYMKDGKKEILTDQETGNATHTTILNK